MKVALITLGCAKNLVDSEMILGLMKDNNVSVTTNKKEADVIIINTCGFIESAKEEAISTIFNTLSEKEEHQKVIVVGCLATRYKDELTNEISEVDRFISIKEYPYFASIFNEVVKQDVLKEKMDHKHRLLSTLPHTAYVRIADGCDNRCAYCAIPLIRGNYVSRRIDDIVLEVKYLINKGVKEIVLIAQDTTRFGKENNESIEELLNKICQIDDLYMVRLLYLYPNDVDQKLIDTFKNNPRIAPYFDIPVQHGSNKILKLMNRRDTKEKIISLAKTIRANFEDPILRTTLIVGFPNETEEDFNELLDLIKEVKFDRLGVFKYSNEEDTLAYTYKNHVSEEEKERRYNIVMELQSKIAQELSKSKIGKTYEAIIEGYDKTKQMYFARSYAFANDAVDGYIYLRNVKNPKIGNIVKVKIVDALIYDLIGEII